MPSTIQDDLAFTPDGKTIVSCQSSADLWLWDLAAGKGERRSTGEAPESGLTTLCVAPDGELVAAAGGKEIRLYDLKTDPDELHNLYGQKEHAKITAKLKKQLVKLQKHYQDDSDISENPVAWQKQVRPGE